MKLARLVEMQGNQNFGGATIRHRWEMRDVSVEIGNKSHSAFQCLPGGAPSLGLCLPALLCWLQQLRVCHSQLDRFKTWQGRYNAF